MSLVNLSSQRPGTIGHNQMADYWTKRLAFRAPLIPINQNSSHQPQLTKAAAVCDIPDCLAERVRTWRIPDGVSSGMMAINKDVHGIDDQLFASM
jgi:hypothetical protein